VNLSHKPMRTTGQSGLSLEQAGREAAERLHRSIFPSGFAITLGRQGKSENRKQRHWKEVVESFSQRWCRVLDRALAELCIQVLTGPQTTRIQAASMRSCCIVPYSSTFPLSSFCYKA